MSRVVWETPAVEALNELQRALRKRLMDAVRTHAAGGRVDIKKLAGRGDEWRIRVGDWRVIFTTSADTITVLAVDNRRDAYD